MQNFTGTSEEDDEEETELAMKEEDDYDDDNNNSEEINNAIASNVGVASSNSNSRFHIQEQLGGLGGRRSRPVEEKERTKLRERQRRAITARILAGLRRHGNYNLRVRADINDVIAALAREAGWVVLPDGTTFPARSQGSRPGGGGTSAVMASSSSQMLSPRTPAPLKGVSSIYRSSVEANACHVKDVNQPSPLPYDLSSITQCQNAALIGDGEHSENHLVIGGSVNIVGDKQERDFAGTPYVPVYMMLPLGVINMKCELVDPDGIVKQLRVLKSINVDGVKVNCWWGIVEAHTPQEYNWNGYRRLFQIVLELRLKLHVAISFHECGGNVGDDVCIPLPHWVAEIGRINPNIFFTDKEGRHNPECLSWGIDKERVLRGRTAVEVYFDFMRSFRVEFNEFFENGIFSMIEIGLGPCGDLRYPSYPVKHGWRFPGIGEFQCYDQYLLKRLRKEAEGRGHSFWARGPDDAGTYTSRPHETGFFCDGGDYDGYYGRFFLSWYSQVLIDHGDRVLSLAKLAFEGTCIAAKLSGIHWWYKTASHAAELTAGIYNSCNRDGYAPVVTMIKRHGAIVNLTSAEIPILDQSGSIPEALADPDGLVWQVLNAAWDIKMPVASENSFSCYDGEDFNKILCNAKPLNSPDGRHLSAFTYLRLNPILMERNNLVGFEQFVKKMHGESSVQGPQL